MSVLWLLLPFAIVSIQKKCKELVTIEAAILAELKKLNGGVADIVQHDPLVTACASCGFENPVENMECSKCGLRMPLTR